MKNLKRILARKVAEELNTSLALVRMSSGASSKMFFRISGALPQRWNKESLVLMWMNTPRSFSDYRNINNLFLKHNISVPQVYFTGRTGPYMVMEDCGDRTLEKAVCQGGTDTKALYESAIDLLLGIQRLKPAAECVLSRRYFDVKKFMSEYAMHIRKYLLAVGFKRILSRKEDGMFRKEYATLAQALASQNRVPVHRDFQSSNLILSDKGSLTMVDFQDARMGFPLYDLVALLEDAYVCLSADAKEELIRYYLNRADEAIIPHALRKNFRRMYDWTLIQRKLHDAGAFVYCFENFGNRKYLRYISGAVECALTVMKRYDVFSRSHELLSSIMKDGKDDKK